MWYSKEDEELLKVSKMILDRSEEALEYARTNKAEVDSYVEHVKKQYNISVPDISDVNQCISEKNRIKDQSWEEIVKEAEQHYPSKITIEDVLTQEERQRAYARVDEINREFSQKTSLNKVDIAFLTVATALQCVRQYVLDPFLKDIRKSAGSHDEPGSMKSGAEPGWYHADTDKILVSRVPFDVQRYGDNSTVQGFLSGGNHRFTTLGHDPMLGWVFGTANILTNTVTRSDFRSAHVKYVPQVGNTIYSLADTGRIFTSCANRLFNEGWDGKLAVACAIVREAIHLKSDIGTKNSLPLPVLSTLSPDLTRTLAKYGIDTASVGKEASLSVLINTLISMVHRLFFDESVDDPKLYEVRTRKILLYSNTIASTSNVIISCLTKRYELLDVGGLIVTIIRLFSDIGFIARIKQEFIAAELYKDIEGTVREINQMYRKLGGLLY